MDIVGTQLEHLNKLAEVYLLSIQWCNAPPSPLLDCLRLGIHPASRTAVRLDGYASK